MHEKPKSLETQIDGNHYTSLAIQPVQYAVANNMGPLEFSILKYITRHEEKGKEADIQKAIHYAQMILEIQYDCPCDVSYPY